MADPKTSNSIISDDNQFSKNLAELETALETPVVPGELETWVEVVHTATKNVETQLTHHIQVTHEELFIEIAEQDDELLGRLEQLREQDASLLREFDELARLVGRLRKTILETDRNETELDQAHSKLVEQGLAFVLGARTQERAIETWYSEAFLRDHGVAD